MNILTLRITINGDITFQKQAFETDRYLIDLMVWLKSNNKLYNISSINIELITREPPEFLKEIFEFSKLDKEFLLYQLSNFQQ